MLNLTSAERKTLFFTIAVLIVSGVYQWIQPNNTSRKTWDYSKSDSTFNRLSKDIASPKLITDKKLKTDSLSSSGNISIHSYNKKSEPDKNKAKPKILPVSININLASSAELQKLPRIGSVMAGRIIKYRKQHGEFKSTEDLLRVKGIGKKTLEKLSPYITVK